MKNHSSLRLGSVLRTCLIGAGSFGTNKYHSPGMVHDAREGVQ